MLEEFVPKKNRRVTLQSSSNPRVVIARQEAYEAHDRLIMDSSDEIRETWKQALSNLHQTYDQIK